MIVLQIKSHLISEHFNIIRCFKCGSYNHKVEDCKNKEKCIKCGDEGHISKHCTKNDLKCINCLDHNIKLNLNLITNHSAYDVNCPIRKKVKEAISKKTKYEV